MDVIVNDRAVPVRGVVGEWDGKPGLQHGIKKIALRSGREVKADYVFFSVGNKPNSALVESVDRGAVVSGMVRVDQYLRVNSPTSLDELCLRAGALSFARLGCPAQLLCHWRLLFDPRVEDNAGC